MSRTFGFLACAVLSLAVAQTTPTTDWTTYGGDLRSTRYKALDQIHKGNFDKLQIAWRFRTDSLGPRPETNFESTPLMVGGVVYTTAGTRRDVVALDAATGELLWERRLAAPTFGCATVAADVVFTVTYDGVVHAFRVDDGAPLWTARLRAGSNSCPAVVEDTLLVGAGVSHPGFERPRRELVAFRLGG
jgi:glucose dehydrogenase